MCDVFMDGYLRIIYKLGRSSSRRDMQTERHGVRSECWLGGVSQQVG